MEFGVHLLRPGSAEQAAMLAAAGPLRISVHLPWRWAERPRGSWDLSSIDHFLAPLREAGLPLQGILGPAMPHLLPEFALRDGGADGDGFVAAFAEHCAEYARRCPDITVFRVEDELNGAWAWDQLRTRRRRGERWRDPGFRADLLAAATSAVRAARPDAELRVTVFAGVPGWRRALRRWASAGVTADRVGLTLQPTMFLPDPRQAARVGEAVEQARAAVSGWAGSPGVEVSRLGFATASERYSPRKQREFLVRAAESASEAGSLGLHWWALRDQAHDDPMLAYWSPSRERHMGLLYYDGLPKAAMEELRVLATGHRFGAAG